MSSENLQNGKEENKTHIHLFSQGSLDKFIPPQLYPLEGDFIETTDHLIFEVKGIEHPKGGVIGFLRYYPYKEPYIHFPLKGTLRERKDIYYSFLKKLLLLAPYSKVISSYLLKSPSLLFTFIMETRRTRNSSLYTHIEKILTQSLPFSEFSRLIKSSLSYFNEETSHHSEDCSEDGEHFPYIKIYDIPKRFSFLEKYHPDYLYRKQNLNYFPLQWIPFEKILKIYYADEFIQLLSLFDTLQNQHTFSSIESLPHLKKSLKDCFDFCSFLSQNSMVTLDYFGITGSNLVGLTEEDSDLDIIIYGFYNSLDVRKFIRDYIKHSFSLPSPLLRKYNYREFRELYKKRGKGSPLSFFQFLKYEERKLHQGIFKNKEFFIRFLEFDKRSEFYEKNLFEQKCILCLGKVKIRGEIRSDKYWWTTPARVSPINVRILDDRELIPEYKNLLKLCHLNPTDIRTTFTLRGRFTENVRLLEHIHAYGTLEWVFILKKEKAALFNYIKHNHGTEFLEEIRRDLFSLTTFSPSYSTSLQSFIKTLIKGDFIEDTYLQIAFTRENEFIMFS